MSGAKISVLAVGCWLLAVLRLSVDASRDACWDAALRMTEMTITGSIFGTKLYPESTVVGLDTSAAQDFVQSGYRGCRISYAGD